MTDLEKVRTWLRTYPGIQAMLSLKVDYFDADPANGSIAEIAGRRCGCDGER